MDVRTESRINCVVFQMYVLICANSLSIWFIHENARYQSGLLEKTYMRNAWKQIDGDSR